MGRSPRLTDEVVGEVWRMARANPPFVEDAMMEIVSSVDLVVHESQASVTGEPRTHEET